MIEMVESIGDLQPTEPEPEAAEPTETEEVQEEAAVEEETQAEEENAEDEETEDEEGEAGAEPEIEGAEEAVEGEEDEGDSGDGDESDELTEEDLDPAITVKVNGVESDVPLSELIVGYQKVVAADERFREAAALKKEAETERNQTKAVMAQFQDFRNPGVGGMPRPFQAIFQLMAPMFGGDYVRAQQYFNEVPLQQYLKVAIDQHGQPGSMEIAWREFKLQEDQRAFQSEKEKTDAEKREIAVRQRMTNSEPNFLKALHDSGLHTNSPEAEEARKILVGRIVAGETITYDQAAEVLKETSTGLEGLLKRRLEAITAEDIEKLSPSIGKQLTERYVARIKKARTTEGGKTGKQKRKKLSPTKSQRSQPRGQKVYDTIEDLTKG